MNKFLNLFKSLFKNFIKVSFIFLVTVIVSSLSFYFIFFNSNESDKEYLENVNNFKDSSNNKETIDNTEIIQYSPLIKNEKYDFDTEFDTENVHLIEPNELTLELLNSFDYKEQSKYDFEEFLKLNDIKYQVFKDESKVNTLYYIINNNQSYKDISTEQLISAYNEGQFEYLIELEVVNENISNYNLVERKSL